MMIEDTPGDHDIVGQKFLINQGGIGGKVKQKVSVNKELFL